MPASRAARDRAAGSSHGPALVTGAGGFIGGRLALRLRQQGTAVRALVRHAHDVAELEAAGAEIIRGDAGDRDTVARAADGCRVLYHLAAARGRRKLGHRGFQEENRRISEGVGEGALLAGVERVVLSSTATVTGWLGPEPQTESTLARPNSPYRASRLQDERIFGRLGRRGLDVVTVRVPQRVMGPGARDWTRLARGVRDGAYRALPADGTIHSGDVDDVIDGLRLCASRPGIAGEMFILGGPAPVRLVEVLGWIADCLGVRFAPRTIPGGPLRGYVKLCNVVFWLTRFSLPHHFTAEFVSARVALDFGKAGRELGYRPRFEVRESVERTVSWLRAQGLV